MQNVATLVTSHVWPSQRRAGFHWIAESLLRRGWHVNFVTGHSVFDYLRGDYRNNFFKMSERNKVMQSVDPNLTTLINMPMMRPIGLQNILFDSFTKPFALMYRHAASRSLQKMVASSNLVVMESTYEIMFAPALRKIAPNARFVYRVSDDLSRRRTHRATLEDEIAFAKCFDLISLPGKSLIPRFGAFSHAQLHLHGVPTHLYDKPSASPYPLGSVNAVFTGNNLLDQIALKTLTTTFPEVTFHVLGPFKREVTSSNVIYYGEMAYEATIPYVVHGDIGLNILTVDGFSESNKMQQYRYCGLPVVLNAPISDQHQDRFTYCTGDYGELVLAFQRALSTGRGSVGSHAVRSWDDLVCDLLKEES